MAVQVVIEAAIEIIAQFQIVADNLGNFELNFSNVHIEFWTYLN